VDEISSLTFDNSTADNSPLIVLLARLSKTVNFPSDEISIERDNPMMPPECVILIIHSPFDAGKLDVIGFSDVGVLSGPGVRGLIQPSTSRLTKNNKKTIRGIFISFDVV